MTEPVLHVDFGVLDSSRTELDEIAGTLRDSDRTRDDLARAVGHPVLGAAVGEFTDNWDRHRGELLESLHTMSSTLAQAADAFNSTDIEAARALRTQDAATTSAGTATTAGSSADPRGGTRVGNGPVTAR